MVGSYFKIVGRLGEVFIKIEEDKGFNLSCDKRLTVLETTKVIPVSVEIIVSPMKYIKSQQDLVL